MQQEGAEEVPAVAREGEWIQLVVHIYIHTY